MNPVLQRAGQVLLKAGYSKNAAAGILGNAYQESSWNPASVGSGGGGLWGFTAHPNSLSDLQAYAGSKGAHWTDPALQAEFLTTKIPASVKAEINAKGSPEAAALYFMQNWERPLVSSENAGRRVQGANQALGVLNSLGGAQGASQGRSGASASYTTGGSPRVPGVPATNIKLSTTIPQTSFDQAGYQKAQKAFVVGNYLAATSGKSPWDIGPKSNVDDGTGLLKSLFPQTAAPNPQDFTQTSNQTQTLTLAQSALQGIAGTPLKVHPGVPGSDGINAAVNAAKQGKPAGAGLSKAVNLAIRAANLEKQTGVYHYTQHYGGPGDNRTNVGAGVLSQVHGQKISFDCSGFVGALYKFAGLPSPYGGNNYAGTTFDIPKGGNSRMRPVRASQAVPGDLVVFPDHVALYLGKGQAVSMGGNGDPIVVSVAAEAAYNNRGLQGYYHMKGH